MPLSRKVVSQAVTSVVVYVGGLMVTKFGLHLDPAASAEWPAYAAAVAGAFAGWLAKEDPRLVK